MKPTYLISALLLIILVGGCYKPPTGAVAIVDLEEPEEQEQPAQTAQPEEAAAPAENKTEEAPQELAETAKIIVIKGLKFDPEKLTIDKGATVKWKHNDKYDDREDIMHQISIIMYPLSVKSNRLYFGGEFEYTFNEKGEFLFVDVSFPEKMRGTVTVS